MAFKMKAPESGLANGSGTIRTSKAFLQERMSRQDCRCRCRCEPGRHKAGLHVAAFHGCVLQAKSGERMRLQDWMEGARGRGLGESGLGWIRVSGRWTTFHTGGQVEELGPPADFRLKAGTRISLSLALSVSRLPVSTFLLLLRV